MANIQVADLSLSGSDLFLGESFLSELSEEQANLPHGGVSPFLSLAVTAAFVVTKLVATIAMRVEVSGSLPSLVLND